MLRVLKNGVCSLCVPDLLLQFVTRDYGGLGRVRSFVCSD